MAERREPESEKNTQAGVKPGETPNTDGSRKPDRPVEEEDVFGGHERNDKTKDVESGATKP